MEKQNTNQFPKRPRLPQDAYKGLRRYFITINTFERNKYFITRENCLFVYKYLLSTLKKHNFDAFLFLFMPDHLHLLIEAQKLECNLEKFIRNFKQLSGFYFKKKFNKKLWAKSYYDHILRSDEYVRKIVWYILNNPIRKGLVKNWYEYKYWGSTIYRKEDFYW